MTKDQAQKLLNEEVEKFRVIISEGLEADLAIEDNDIAEHGVEVAREALSSLSTVTSFEELNEVIDDYREELRVTMEECVDMYEALGAELERRRAMN